MFKISVRKLPASVGRFFLMSSWRPWAYGPWTPRPYELVIKFHLGTSPFLRTQTRPALEFVSGEEGLRPKFYFFEYSFLEYALADTLKYAKAPGPHCGAEGRWRRCRIAGLAFYERAVHQMLSLCFPAQCTRRGAPGMTFLLLVGRYVWPPSVPVRYAVCSVSFKVSPNLTKHWGNPVVTGGRGADSCRSDGRAIDAWHKRGHGHARECR